MLELFKSLLSNQQSLDHRFQLLMLRVLIETGNVSQLQGLFRNKVFTDFPDMADALLEISREGSIYFHPPAEQLGLDMLKRLGDYQLLVNELLGRKMIVEALVLI